MRVRLKNIKKAYKGRLVLNIEELTFESGMIYAIQGSNGSGKTTLLRIIAGIEAPDSGEVVFQGDDGAGRRQIAYMPQKPYIFDMTVMDNVLLGIRNMSCDSKLALEALRKVGMESFMGQNGKKLSGGEAQRVAAARTLVLGRKLVLLDEPASSVDVCSMRLIEEYIREANRKSGATVIFTTHNPSQAARMANESILIENGTIKDKGEPSRLFKTLADKEPKVYAGMRDGEDCLYA
ncbi:MAG: ABC transporter ATP-binding protein [Clostridia bacterium]|nr:ABC transporter ATP-binding protein [Clostridia bacterium]